MNMLEADTGMAGTPAADAPAFIDQPDDEKAGEAFAAGYLPAVPPTDYEGSIADWAITMHEAGGPADYSDIVCKWVRKDIYERVLAQCEA